MKNNKIDSRTDFDDFKKSHPIEKYISSLLPITYKGNACYASCPWHEDKTPSFQINIDTQKFYCHSCGEHGDVIDFIQKFEGKSMNEVLTEVEKRGPERIERKIEERAEFSIATWRKVDKTLSSSSANYLRKKGLSIKDMGADCFMDAKHNLIIGGRDRLGALVCGQVITTPSKLNIPGSRVKGSCHIIGATKIGATKRLIAYALCEGWATAVTIHNNSLLTGVCCFGFGNMMEIVRILEGQKVPFFLFPDKDKGGYPLPHKILYPLDAPGTDWNDLFVDNNTNMVNILNNKLIAFLSTNEMPRLIPHQADIVGADEDLFTSPRPQQDHQHFRPVFCKSCFLFITHPNIVKEAGKDPVYTEHKQMLFSEGKWNIFLVEDLEGKSLYLRIDEERSQFRFDLNITHQESKQKEESQRLYLAAKKQGLIAGATPTLLAKTLKDLPLQSIKIFTVLDAPGWQIVNHRYVLWVNKESYIAPINLPVGRNIATQTLPEWAKDLMDSNPIFFFLVCHIGYYGYKKFIAFDTNVPYQGGHITHLVGGSGTGKTTLCALWNRLLGMSQFQQLNQTINRINNMLKESEELFLDETESLRGEFEKFMKSFIYEVSGGATRGRVYEKSQTFATGVITTGERHILHAESQQGAHRRVIQLNADCFLAKSECARLMKSSTIQSIRETIITGHPTLVVEPIIWEKEGLHIDINTMIGDILAYGKDMLKHSFDYDVNMAHFETLKDYVAVSKKRIHVTLTPENENFLRAIHFRFEATERRYPHAFEYCVAYPPDAIAIRNTDGFIKRDGKVFIKAKVIKEVSRALGTSAGLSKQLAALRQAHIIVGDNEDNNKDNNEDNNEENNEENRQSHTKEDKAFSRVCYPNK